ncbi:MAG: hypothetical protein QXP81_08680 [Nitrososphaerota archaeon]
MTELDELELLIEVGSMVQTDSSTIGCPRCGEPWDAIGVLLALAEGESFMTKDEAVSLVLGRGCPRCRQRGMKR